MIAVITALAGGVVIASGLWGFGITKLPWVFRILQIIAGAMVILRDWRFETLGFALIGLSVLFQILQVRKSKLAAA